jgi:hypothetical protein
MVVFRDISFTTYIALLEFALSQNLAMGRPAALPHGKALIDRFRRQQSGVIVQLHDRREAGRTLSFRLASKSMSKSPSSANHG